MCVLFDIKSTIVKERFSGVTSLSALRQFVEIQRRSACQKTWDVVYRSEDGNTISRDNKIIFRQAKLSERQLHSGSSNRTLRFVSYRRRLRDKHDIIAWFEPSLYDITIHGERSMNISLETPFNDFEDNGVGSALIGRAVVEGATNVIKICAQFNHFIGPKYKASIPTTSLCVMNIDWNGREASTNSLKEDVREPMILRRRKTICQIPGFITRH